MDQTLLAVAALSFVAGAVIAWLLSQAVARRQRQDTAHAHQGALVAQQTLFAETAKRLGDIQEELKHARETVEATRVGSMTLREENAQLRTELAHQREVVPEKLALLEKAQE